MPADTGINGTRVAVIFNAKGGTHAVSIHAFFGGAGIVIVTNARKVQALSVGAKIIRTRVVVIKNAKRLVDAGSACIAEIARTQALVITIFRNMHTLSVYAIVICAGVAIIQNARRIENTIACNTGIVCTGIIIVTHLRRMKTLPVHADVIGTGICICAVSWLKYASTVDAAVNRADIVIVADNRGKGA